ncbi:uncharacterized protein [Dermacentor andersoni]|uniref:uncharacterized protein isoform X2 n=1 Tax=Dermacentor andersoni TaxID=34620 RepID=UPI003B3B14EF
MCRLERTYNFHNWHEEPYHQCLHDELPHKDWLGPKAVVFHKPSVIVLNRRLLMDIAQLSSKTQTFCLGSFHALPICFAPKSVAYSPNVMPTSMDTITLFAELIKRNATLRRLRLPSSLNVCLKSSWDPDKQFPDPQAATCMKSLCEALQESNSSLSQLSIDLRPFEEAECHAFFGAVADNKEIKSVVVKSLPCIDGIDRVSTTIRERGLDDRVVVKSFCIHHNTIKLQQCPQIYNATIASSKTISNVLPSVMTALRVVCGCKHVTSLCVHTDVFKCYEFCALAAYIRVSSTLNEVDIYIPYSRVGLSDKPGNSGCGARTGGSPCL